MRLLETKVITIAIAIFLQGCVAQEKKQRMEDIIQEVKTKVNVYKKRPLYGVQVNKNACRIIIEIEGGLDYRFTENAGESMMLPLNVMLFESGAKTAIIKIYPRECETLITKEAYVKLNFTVAADKESGLNEYKEIASFALPENIGELEVPYFEAKVPFEVKVSFDHSHELAMAIDLKTVPQIEENIVQKYNKIRKICQELNEIGYAREVIHSSINVFNNLYDSTEEQIAKGYETKFAVVDSSLYNREFLPIKNYEIKYYANNKIVALWQKNLNPMLYIKANYKYTSGEEAFFEGGDPIFLYLPKDADELQVW